MPAMRRDCLVYMSGPITARPGFSVERNTADAVHIYWRLLNLGIPAFCPHLTAIFPTAHSSVSYETWLEYDYAILDRCTHFLLLARWQTSKGAMLEKIYAEKLGLPIYIGEAALLNAFGL